MPGDRRRCAFCNERPAKKSKEHVFPDWFLQEFELWDYPIRPTARSFSPLTNAVSEGVVHERAHTLGTYRVGGICRPCNNGWMSQLESQAKPILLPLMKRDRVLRLWGDLSDDESRLIAAWAYRTACAIDLAGGTPPIIPSGQRHFFYLNHRQPPPYVSVFAAVRAHTRCVDHRVLESPLVSHGPAPWDSHPRGQEFLETLYGENGYKHYMVGFSVMGLVLGVFYWPFPKYPIFAMPVLHHPIWKAPEINLEPWPVHLAQFRRAICRVAVLDSREFTGAFLQHLVVYLPP